MYDYLPLIQIWSSNSENHEKTNYSFITISQLLLNQYFVEYLPQTMLDVHYMF